MQKNITEISSDSRAGALGASGRGGGTHISDHENVIQRLECQFSKLDVEGSNPFILSKED